MQNVSSLKMDNITKSLGFENFSRSHVRDMTNGLNEQKQSLKERLLGESFIQFSGPAR